MFFSPGSGFALTFFPSVISVSFYFQKRRAMATGIAVCGAGVGGFIMAPFGRYLLDIYDWKNAMLIVAGIALNGCVFGALLRPLEPLVKKKRPPRKKNFVDRLVEQTKKRNRKESECSACAHGTGAQSDIMLRIQEVKQAREAMLRDEDSEYEFGSSVPNSTVNSVRRLDRSDSCASAGYTPARSQNIQIPRQEVLRREASQISGSPTSLGTSPPWPSISPQGMGMSAPAGCNYPASPSRGSDTTSLLSNNLPTIIIENDYAENDDADDENSRIIRFTDDPAEVLDRRRSTTFKTVPEEDEDITETGSSLPNGYKNGIKIENSLLEKLKKSNGIEMNGSLPNGIPYADKLANGTLDSNNCLVEGRRRHHSKSAGDVNTIAAHKRKLHPGGIEKVDYSRPMYRKDIFYSGSMLNMPNVTHFRSQPDVKTYLKSMMSIPETVAPEKESCLCRLLPKSAKDIIREMLDVTLFREPIFLVAAVGNLFAFIGLFIPFVFIADRAIMMGISVDKAAFLLSVIGQ